MYLQTATKLIDKVNQEIFSLLPNNINADFILTLTQDKNISISPEMVGQIQKPAKALLQTGGKRWRPLLTIITTLLLSDKNFSQSDLVELGAKAGAIVELAHNGSLIIDDIEDSALMRRGIDCAHISYGVDLAINAGNYLYFLPALAINKLPLSEKQLLQIYKVYCRQMGYMHLGQGMDIIWHKNPNHFPTVDEYKTMCHLKTGALSQMAIEIGAILASGDESKKQILVSVSKDIGLAFQILDDITNLKIGNPGKERGDDLIEGKKSLPLILYAHKGDQSKLISLIEQIQNSGLKNSTAEVDQLIALLESTNAISEASQIATSLLEGSVNLITANFPASEVRDFFIDLIRKFQK